MDPLNNRMLVIVKPFRKGVGALSCLLFAGFLALGAPAAAQEQNDIIGHTWLHVIEDGETLIRLARDADMGVLEVMAVNPGIDPWTPEVGTTIIMPDAHILPNVQKEGLIVNLAELRLYYIPSDGSPSRTSAIGVGRDAFTTPLGTTTIVRKRANPVWYPTAATRADDPTLPAAVPSGPDNPLGLHALYLGWATYLIHGTNKPPGVGRRVSRGCIRMYPESVERLFGIIKVGTKVQVISQPVKLGWKGGELYIEVHPSHAQIDQLEVEERFDNEPVTDFDQNIVDAAGLQTYRLNWPVIRSSLRERRGLPIKITQDIGTL